MSVQEVPSSLVRRVPGHGPVTRRRGCRPRLRRVCGVARTYDVVTVNRAGNRRMHRYTTDVEFEPGQVLRLDGRFWVVARIEAVEEGDVVGRADATPARYRLRLQHPDGREEIGAFRRFRPDAPRLGHAFTTLEDGRPESWEVVDERLAFDERGEAYLDLVAQRDFAEVDEEPPDHELEHALARSEESLPPEAVASFERAQTLGLAVELAALEPGEAPDWEEAERFLEALVLDEIEDDVLVLCGVDTERAPRESWLDTVKARLREDLRSFRADIEGEHDEIEEWDFLDGRIFASVGTPDDEADPNKGHGWMCRLLDGEVLGAGGFSRVRKASLVV
jgi:hypothetical protein